MEINPEYPVQGSYSTEDDQKPKKKVKEEKVSTYQKDSVEYKNQETFEREKVNEQVTDSLTNVELKKPSKWKMFLNHFKKKPSNEPPKYNYDTNPPPYDK